MNAKKVKELRRLARNSTVGAPERQTLDRRQDRFGNERIVHGAQRQYVGKSTHGLYRALKKMARENAK